MYTFDIANIYHLIIVAKYLTIFFQQMIYMENTIGNRIHNVIKALNISKAEFCAKMDVAPTVIYNILNGRNKPGFDLLGKIINTFNVDPNYLLRGTGEMFISNDDFLMNTNFEPYMNQSDKNNKKSDLGDKNIKGQLNSSFSAKRDIISRNKEFLDTYSYLGYGDIEKESYVYLQIMYYDTMTYPRVYALYNVEFDKLRTVYQSYLNLVNVLNSSQISIDKKPQQDTFDKLFELYEKGWKEDFKGLSDNKLEIILKLLHLKSDIDFWYQRLSYLVDYMSEQKDHLIGGKSKA